MVTSDQFYVPRYQWPVWKRWGPELVTKPTDHDQTDYEIHKTPKFNKSKFKKTRISKNSIIHNSRFSSDEATVIPRPVSPWWCIIYDAVY